MLHCTTHNVPSYVSLLYAGHIRPWANYYVLLQLLIKSYFCLFVSLLKYFCLFVVRMKEDWKRSLPHFDGNGVKRSSGQPMTVVHLEILQL